MSRYIDFYLIGELVDSHGNVHYEDLKNLPTADVVPMEFHERCMELEIKKRANMVAVVRCKDCTHCADDWNGNQPMFTCELGMCHESVEPNGYCFCGERREDDEIH